MGQSYNQLIDNRIPAYRPEHWRNFHFWICEDEVLRVKLADRLVAYAADLGGNVVDRWVVVHGVHCVTDALVVRVKFIFHVIVPDPR